MFCRMPMLSFVTHLSLIHTDRFPTRIAVFGEHSIEAVQAKGPPIPHYVPLAPELSLAFGTREVFHVPGPSFRFRTLVGEDNLQSERMWVNLMDNLANRE